MTAAVFTSWHVALGEAVFVINIKVLPRRTEHLELLLVVTSEAVGGASMGGVWVEAVRHSRTGN